MTSVTLLRTFQQYDCEVRNIVFSPDGLLFAPIPSDGGRISFYHTFTGDLQSTTANYHEIIWDIQFSSNDKLVLIAYDDGIARLYNTNTGGLVREFTDTSEDGYERMFAAIFTPDGESIITGTDIVQVWNVNTGELKHSLLHTGDRDNLPVASLEAMTNVIMDSHEIWSLDFSPDDKYLISASSKTATLRLWDTRTWTLKFETNGRNLFFSPDGKTFMTAGGANGIKLWSTETLTLRQAFQGESPRFSPDGRIVATRAGSHKIDLWDVETGHLKHALCGYGTNLPPILFTPNSQKLASKSGRIVHIWDIATGQLEYLLEDHGRLIHTFVMTPAGNVLATGSRDHSVRLWDIDTGVCLQVLEGHKDEVYGVQFSPDGSRLTTSSEDGTVFLWKIEKQ
ncbi:hypothetical protein KCV07_g2832, partial [Aureobasidium melanogenum]